MVEHEGVIQQKQQEELPTNKLTYKKQLQLLTLTPYFCIVVYTSHLNNNTFSFKVRGHTFYDVHKKWPVLLLPQPSTQLSASLLIWTSWMVFKWVQN